MVSAKWQARAEAIRVMRERQVESNQQATKEEAAWMEVERRAATMKLPLKFSYRLFPINFYLDLSFRCCVRLTFPRVQFQIHFSDFRLATYCIHIHFRLVVLKMVKLLISD